MSIDLVSILEKLPPLSPSTQKLLSCLQKDEVNTSEVESLLVVNPIIAGRLLQMANSSFYGFNREIISIHEAFVILGGSTVKNLVYTMAVIEQFTDKKQSAASPQLKFIESVWLHSLYSACFVRALASQKKSAADNRFIASLFQHLGLVILMHCEPDKILSALKSEQNAQTDIIALIQQRCGMHYCALSAKALETWRFPVDVCNLIDPAIKHKEGDVIQLGNCLADAQGFTLIPDRFMPTPTAEALKLLPDEDLVFGALMSQTDTLFADMRQNLLS